MASTGNNGFAARLRELRERTRPEEIGLPAGDRRRVPGLRREELAAFSALSVDYVTRLEQGHANSPSAEVVAALGRAMRLPRMELELLHQLAGHAAPHDLDVPRHLSPGLTRLIDRLGNIPVAAYDATWTLLSCNTPWRRLRGARESQPGYNLVRAAFSDKWATQSQDPEYGDRLQRSLVADLRISAARYPADQGMQQLLRELFEGSAAFAATWAEGRAHPFTTEPKMLRHPELGDFWLDCDVLTAADGDARLVLYTAAAGTAGEMALAALTAATPRTTIDPTPITP